ncbi:MAG: outer membrane protein assembly factor BamD [Bacteroidota bacterium]
MKYFVFVIGTLFLILLFESCAATQELESLPADVRYQRAKDLFDEEKYLEAIEEFKIVSVQYQGSEYADDAQFYLAESRFYRGEFILAAAEYDNLVRMMPTSPFASTARYKKALSHYRLSPKPQLDQKYSRYAVDDFQTFIEFSPNDSLVADAEAKISELTEKMARKIFDSGRLYYRMNYYRASISYFDKVISEYTDTPYADDAMVWKARSQSERKDFSGALATLDALPVKFPTSDVIEEADELRIEIREEEADYREEQRENARLSDE